MSRHHHHSQAPVVVAALLGIGAAVAAYVIGKAETTSLGEHLHDDSQALSALVQRLGAVVNHNTDSTVGAIRQLSQMQEQTSEQLNDTLRLLVPPSPEGGGPDGSVD